MRINIVINDETVKNDIWWEIHNAQLREDMIQLDDSKQIEFEEDCLDEIASKMECYPDYIPTEERVKEVVYDLAERDGYLK